MSKKIIVLGAGIYQVPLIKKAKEMGLYSIVISKAGDYPGFAFADKKFFVDTTDKEIVLKIAKEEGASAIVTTGTDVSVPTQGYVCDALGLCGPSFKAAEMAQSKVLMKKAFVEHGVRTARHIVVDIDNSFPKDICDEIGYPVMFKAVDTSGSRGVTRVVSPEQIPFAYREVVGHTRNNAYIIEKCICGEEFGAQAFVHHGQIKFILPHGDYVFQGVSGVPVGHYAPYDISDAEVSKVERQLRMAIDALGIDNCAVNADFIYFKDEPYVLEIGARAGATGLVELTEQFYGFDYYRQIILCALGGSPDFTPKNISRQACVVKLFTSPRDGRIVSFPVEQRVDDPRIIDLSFDYKVGDVVRAFRKGPDRIGQCVAIADSVREAEQLVDDAMEKMSATIA